MNFLSKITLTFAVALVPLATAHAQDSLESLHQQAVDAGQTEINVYLPAVRAFQPLIDKFTEAYPDITVTTTELSGPALFARLEAEKATGAMNADFIISGDLDFPVLAEDGWLQAFEPLGVESLGEAYVGADNGWIVWALGPVGVVVNTTVVDKDGPHSWSDLNSPEFAGKMVINNPATPSTSTVSMATLFAEGRIDDAWVDGFAAQNPSTAASTSAMMQSMATGQYPVAPFLPYALYRVLAAQGAPVDFWFMEDGNPAMPLSAGIVAGAPHADAGRLFSSWLISDQGVALQNSLGQISTVDGAPKQEGLTEVLAVTGQDLSDALSDWKSRAARLGAN
ncbi:extracellular solute-binding protein [Hoeflea sp. WL0058]|uniref:Extracellular solute-binding protein n=1 Tax=Flavimaribacter sediminis TaxID=2865987 RepID=A0AAE2ZPC0_9HYPH|nr:extracellular solute-binding protein [Flavimaribacter sediminis]MBW8638460.1 extracellular solute-binding protein [Flavimaribacter sediminis]